MRLIVQKVIAMEITHNITKARRIGTWFIRRLFNSKTIPQSKKPSVIMNVKTLKFNLFSLNYVMLQASNLDRDRSPAWAGMAWRLCFWAQGVSFESLSTQLEWEFCWWWWWWVEVLFIMTMNDDGRATLSTLIRRQIKTMTAPTPPNSKTCQELLCHRGSAAAAAAAAAGKGVVRE